MITVYDEKYKEEVVQLILHVQNDEYGLSIQVEDQPDIMDIPTNYLKNNGNFWIALNDAGEVVGSIGLQRKSNEVAVMKKFFVYKDYRGKEFGIGAGLYQTFFDFARESGFAKVVLDTPSTATRSHGFYKKVGFKQIMKEELPIQYDYPDRDSLIFVLDL
jgi:N-acetylglutamate synthase-like GNAT family acetyltransferase